MTKNIKNSVYKNLATLPPDELREFLIEHKIPAFRAKQIEHWVFQKWIVEPEKMGNISKELKLLLEEHYPQRSKLIKCHESDDKTKKLLIELHDGELIEAVIIPSHKRTTFCLSTQVGCPVKCTFCASGTNGLTRNLTAAEIVDQLLIATEESGRPDNIVMMGIGEGLLNFENLTEALGIFCKEDQFNLAARRITVSTSGWVKGIRKLADLQMQWNLAISLHAPNDLIRRNLIPDEFRCPVSEIIDACHYYREKTNRMVTFEYIFNMFSQF
jgi:23S rRNA (adenine2503-C2)-methyltransferase